jgi:hypothetical protein
MAWSASCTPLRSPSTRYAIGRAYAAVAQRKAKHGIKPGHPSGYRPIESITPFRSGQASGGAQYESADGAGRTRTTA